MRFTIAVPVVAAALAGCSAKPSAHVETAYLPGKDPFTRLTLNCPSGDYVLSVHTGYSETHYVVELAIPVLTEQEARFEPPDVSGNVLTRAPNVWHPVTTGYIHFLPNSAAIDVQVGTSAGPSICNGRYPL